MKVILLNGSPNINGCTKRALTEVATEIQKNGIETEIIDIQQNLTNCNNCNACTKLNKCVKNDQLNEVAEKIKNAEGLVIGSPVYFASANGIFISFLDRLFRSSGKSFAYKIGASVVSARRAGTTATFDELNKYFLFSNMIIAPSNYWNAVHGNTAKEVEEDIEGLQTMRILGRNMSWLIKNLSDKEKPVIEPKIKTNFVRSK